MHSRMRKSHSLNKFLLFWWLDLCCVHVKDFDGSCCLNGHGGIMARHFQWKSLGCWSSVTGKPKAEAGGLCQEISDLSSGFKHPQAIIISSKLQWFRRHDSALKHLNMSRLSVLIRIKCFSCDFVVLMNMVCMSSFRSKIQITAGSSCRFEDVLQCLSLSNCLSFCKKWQDLHRTSVTQSCIQAAIMEIIYSRDSPLQI